MTALTRRLKRNDERSSGLQLSRNCASPVHRPLTMQCVQGRGLGKNFLRHLRRTTGMLHVLDASAGRLCLA